MQSKFIFDECETEFSSTKPEGPERTQNVCEVRKNIPTQTSIYPNINHSGA